ncbi:hypothetical protein [Thermocrinis minervae]|uniref:Uncharacterized protein n=1 Tax=Thermocrinis minervae TaxID=381751 RepID=A0A1M6RYT0_9AQUI|nr:hypothetical protein [Thermocrinis minervae]SHK37467.1 hypothetical protein SAMN05444391_0812 [Thermocrinis minervae]
MDTREQALKLSHEVVKDLIDCGTKIDEYYRRFRELRVLEDSLSFQAALLNLEHAFFMVVQSMIVLKDQIGNLQIAARKEEIY